MKERMKLKRLLSFLLTLVMVVGMLPMGQVVYADDTTLVDTVYLTYDTSKVKLNTAYTEGEVQKLLRTAACEPNGVSVEEINTFLLYDKGDKGGTMSGIGVGSSQVMEGRTYYVQYALKVASGYDWAVKESDTTSLNFYLNGVKATPYIIRYISSSNNYWVYFKLGTPSTDQIVRSVSIDQTDVTVHRGSSHIFTANVAGNVTDKTVTWSVSGNKSSSTNISDEGVLSVGSNETATTVTVTATSNADSTKSASQAVTIFSINSVDIEIAVPVPGAQPKDAISNTDNTKATLTEWSSDGKMIYETDTFEEGKTYRVRVVVHTINNNFFADTATVTVNGSTAGTILNNKNSYISFYTEFTTGHTITVTDGKAIDDAGTEIIQAAEGTEVTLTADTAPAGQVFDKWEVESGSITLADANSATTTFTMPAGPVSVKAIYKSTIIDSVDIKIAEPVAGAKPQDAVSYTENVSVGTSGWSHDGTTFSSSNTFVAGETYQVTAIVIPKSGYTFADNPSATFNGSKAATVTKNGGDIICYAEFTAVNATIIDPVDVKITEPLAGTSPQNAVSNTANVSVSDTQWRHNGKLLSASDTFEAGETYEVTVLVGTDSNKYAFPDEPTVTFNGYKAGTVELNDNELIYYSAKFTVPVPMANFEDDPSTALDLLNAAKTAGAADSTWNAADKTLTLNGVNYKTFATTALQLPGGATIILNGDNTITGGGSDSSACYGIFSTGKLTIKGSGKLTVTGGDATNNSSYGICTSVFGIAIEGGDITAVGGTATDSYGISGNGGVKIISGSLLAKGQTKAFGAQPNLEITDYWWRTSNSDTYNEGSASPYTWDASHTYVEIRDTHPDCSITFDANDGTGTMADVTGVYGSYTLPENGFTAPAGKQFKGWATSADGTVISGTTIDIAADTTLYAIWENIPVAKYDITVKEGKATAGGVEVSKAAEGTTVTLTADTAPDGKVFDKWEVESGSMALADANSESTTFTMPASAVSVKAIYKSTTPTPATKYWCGLYTTNSPYGKVRLDKLNDTSESLGQDFDSGTELSVYAYPDEGYLFKEWQDEYGNVVSTSNPYTFALNSETNLYAIFESAPAASTDYTITVTGGKATSSTGAVISKAAEGNTVNLTADTAPAGRVFDKWVVESGSMTLADADSETTIFLMPASAVSVKATYKSTTPTPATKYWCGLYTTNSPYGKVRLDKLNDTSELHGQNFDSGTELTAYAYPDEGYLFKEWQDKDGNVVSTSNPYTLTLNSETNLYAIFEAVPAASTDYTITVTDGKATSSTGAVISKAAEGTTVNLTANAAPAGQVFDKWLIVSGSITLADANSLTTTFVMPAGAVSVKAGYKAAPPAGSNADTGNKDADKPVEVTPAPVPAIYGIVITDKAGSSYKVTKSDANASEVTFAKPKNSVKGTVIIPDTVIIDGITYKVTTIEANAFKNKKNITKVIIGKNVTVIGKNAFSGCKKLKSIIVKTKKLKKVGKKALKGIHAKAKIKVPKSKLKQYKTLFKNKGQGKKVKVTR